MSNALFLIYFSIVNGVESLGEVYRGTWSPQGQWSQRCVGDRWRGAVLGLAPLLRNPFCASTSSQRLSLGFPWDLVPPEDRAPFVRLKDADLRGTGPRGLLMDDALWCHLVRALRATAGLSFGVGTYCLHLSVWIAFARLLRPTQNNRRSSSRLLLMKDHLGSLFGVVFCVACLCGREKDTRTGRTACWGRRVPAQGPGASTLITFYFNFCVLAILNCKTNRCLQYNTCIKNNNNKNKA